MEEREGKGKAAVGVMGDGVNGYLTVICHSRFTDV